MSFKDKFSPYLKWTTFTAKNYKLLNSLIIFLVLLTKGFTMLEWIFDNQVMFTTNAYEATTKFNTAFLFFIAAICLLISNKKKYTIFLIILITTLFAISGLTLAEYIFSVDLFVDNFLIEDTISTLYPGRMSVATSACFIFLSIGLISLYLKNKTLRKVAQSATLLVSMISFMNIITLLLKIPTSDRTIFFATMSLQTAISFAFLSFALAFKFPGIGFTKMFFGNYFGSKSLRKLIPLIVGVPFVLSFLLLTLINKEILEPQFGILLYTIILIFLSFLYTMIVALGLNKSDKFRKTLESDLIHKNEELFQFKEALDEIAIVAITDENAVIKYVNDNFCAISKYTREEIIGNTSLIVRSDYHPEAYFWDAWHQVSSGKPWFGEIKNRAKDGSHYWTESSVIPLKTKIGSIKEFMSIQLDITKRKEAEELLASKYVKTLEQKNQELEQYSYIASHDLQEPLRTITSFSDILFNEYNDKLDDNAKQIFSFIKQATGRMSSLIKNLLDYSRIGYQEELTKIDSNQLLKDISSDLSALISQTNTVIEINELPIINGYPTVLRLLFQNLLTNAIKFTEKGVDPIIKINAIKKKEFWEFSIKDNGIGIKKEYQNKIFAIFQRLHLKEEYEGTGIGLAHCKKIVSLHGGEIWVKSTYGKGSTFYFTISNL
jgi:PAS domain S-box-containing protein